MTEFRTRTLRLVLAGALSLGVLGAATTSAHALTPPAPQQQGPGDIAIPDGPDNPDDDLDPAGPGDATAPDDGDECHPLAASCDITSDPGDPGDPDGGDPEVDDAVVAHPTFTG